MAASESDSARVLKGHPGGGSLPQVLDPAWVDEQGRRFATAVEQTKAAIGYGQADIEEHCRRFRAALDAVSKAIGRPYP